MVWRKLGIHSLRLISYERRPSDEQKGSPSTSPLRLMTYVIQLGLSAHQTDNRIWHASYENVDKVSNRKFKCDVNPRKYIVCAQIFVHQHHFLIR
jgi:hypothetical protein